MTYTRPDLSFATQELAGSLQQPTYLDMRRVQHTLRYLQGTQEYKFILHPATTLGSNKEANNDARKSNNSLRTERESELCSSRPKEHERRRTRRRAQEELHIRIFLMETILTNKLQTHIHTDSSSTKRIATRTW